MSPVVKNEIITSAEKSFLALFGATVTLSDISTIVTILVGLATFAFVTIQGVFLLRKWWLLERSNRPPKWGGD